tara:strand:+ start:326 stop:1300 length:975 start_codon:yes stop_codon:yes gene_type:complete
MKKNSLLFIVILILFTGCETDFDVNTDWKETTVVYGLLDASLDTQFIRINKGYLGNMSAIDMANYSDSIHFNPNYLQVKLHKLQFTDTLMSLDLDTILIDKEEGFFANDNNIIYRAITPSNFLKSDREYVISIKNLLSDNFVNAKTEVISSFDFLNFNSAYKFGFYNAALPDSTKFRSKNLDWNKVDNGVIYQLDVRFNYLENGEFKYLVWTQPLVRFTGIQMNTKLEGTKFFSFLRNNLENDDSVIREFLSLDLIMTIGTEDLNAYIQVNAPISSIVQERSEFSNINNGIGLFSSRYTHVEFDIDLTDDTKQYIIEKLDKNFQ